MCWLTQSDVFQSFSVVLCCLTCSHSASDHCFVKSEEARLLQSRRNRKNCLIDNMFDSIAPAGPGCLSVTVSSSKPKVEVHEHTGETAQTTDIDSNLSHVTQD